MNTYEKIKELTKRRGISVRELEKRLGYSNGYFSKWKKVSPNSDGVTKVADYFGVSVDYLLGRTDKEHYYDLSEKDQLDVAKEAERMLAGLETDAEVNFYGEPLDEEDRDKLRDALELALSLTRVKAKKKFTPKKFRDDNTDNK